MAIIKQGILGGIQNKIGNVVGTSWKGISVIKSLPVSVANPKTAAQVAQRDRFTAAVKFASEILGTVIKPLWDRFSQRQSGYNAFVSANIANFEGVILETSENLIISRGKMAATPMSDAEVRKEGGIVTITWVDDSGQGFKQATDLAYAVAYNRATAEATGTGGTVTRADGTISFVMNGDPIDGVDLYLAFRRADGTIVSDTSYQEVFAD
ncbi:MAG: hypothetical protein HC892_22760 [Saprospiraceae bacterium]|nr:hypothetical protein [Saprospiraceae bacterium]